MLTSDTKSFSESMIFLKVITSERVASNIFYLYIFKLNLSALNNLHKIEFFFKLQIKNQKSNK